MNSLILFFTLKFLLRHAPCAMRYALRAQTVNRER